VGVAESSGRTARKLFGTDGVRGVANVEPMTVDTAVRLGRALAQQCRRQTGRRHRIVVGKDTRRSGGMLEAALSAGICSMGVDALCAGVLPTPAIAYLTRTLGASAGVVVSASHNPFQDNGIKIFASTGFKLPDEAETEIEQLCVAETRDSTALTGTEVGTVAAVDDAAARYRQYLEDAVPAAIRLRGLKIVIDCAYGAAYSVGPQVLRDLGAEVSAIGVNPDGENINEGCGAVHPSRLQEAVRAEQAHLGIALDGDADRLILVDELGEMVDGDEVLAMLAVEMLARGTLRGATVVATVMSNLGLEVALRDRGCRLVRVQVGDRYVVEEMQRHGYNLGGEQSGHLLLLDHATTGDGLLAALHVVALMVARQQPLSALKRVMSKFPQVLVNVRVAERRELDTVPAVHQTISRIRAALADRGRVLVRYSGTEPLIRVMVEGERAEQVHAYAEEIAATIRTEVGGN
jgi:phosphoglucosamine mutase